MFMIVSLLTCVNLEAFERLLSDLIMPYLILICSSLKKVARMADCDADIDESLILAFIILVAPTFLTVRDF
jgi:hypothetical protein